MFCGGVWQTYQHAPLFIMYICTTSLLAWELACESLPYVQIVSAARLDSDVVLNYCISQDLHFFSWTCLSVKGGLFRISQCLYQYDCGAVIIMRGVLRCKPQSENCRASWPCSVFPLQLPLCLLIYNGLGDVIVQCYDGTAQHPRHHSDVPIRRTNAHLSGKGLQGLLSFVWNAAVWTTVLYVLSELVLKKYSQHSCNSWVPGIRGMVESCWMINISLAPCCTSWEPHHVPLRWAMCGRCVQSFLVNFQMFGSTKHESTIQDWQAFTF